MEKTITIDVKGKEPGRVSTHIANILNGKDSPDYAPNRVPDVRVVVKNTDQMRIPTKKIKQKQYLRYTGYPGGLRTRTMEKEIEIHGKERILHRAVFGMLPKNRLRAQKMKRIVFS